LNATNVSATCAFWLFGYDMSVMGGLITEDPFLSVFPETKNADTQGIVLACLQLGALAGALACLDIGDRLGRRMTVFIGMGFMLVGGSLQASAWSLAQITIGRVLSGIGLGLQVATIPTWQSECSKPTSRGKWVMIEGGLQTMGVACGKWVGYAFFFVKGQKQWRVPVAIQLIPAAIVFCFIMFLPESPRWLFKKGMHAEGVHNLCALRGLAEDDPELIKERDSIMATYEAQNSEEPFKFRELFQQGNTQTLRRVCLAVFIQSAQQLSGINLVSTYANQILRDSFNLPSATSHLIAACGGTEYALCSILSVLMIEGLGRRRAFMITATGMTACFIAIPILLSGGERTPQLVAAGLLFLFNTFFGLAWVGGPFLYSAEIAPLRSRAAVNGIASAANWIFCFLVVMTIPVSFAHIQHRTYIIYAVLNATFIPIIYFFLVETKGRSLEELDVVFAAPGDPVKNEKSMAKHIDVDAARRTLGLDFEGKADGSEKSFNVERQEHV
jgi:sugar porter (SP) family MFS transporter